ncbi:hypothetical protein [Streptomyces globisporus]|uniref:hypothetical protein n=1 Tax=Streptomyces globisporus TaxID=1908 RepID=UPI0037F15903
MTTLLPSLPPRRTGRRTTAPCASSAPWTRPSPERATKPSDEPTHRAGGYILADVDAWHARVLATHLGHYRDPAAREAAAGLLTPPVLAHASLLAELLRLVPGADVGHLAFAARLATTEPEAAGGLAVFLTHARSEAH